MESERSGGPGMGVMVRRSSDLPPRPVDHLLLSPPPSPASLASASLPSQNDSPLAMGNTPSSSSGSFSPGFKGLHVLRVAEHSPAQDAGIEPCMSRRPSLCFGPAKTDPLVQGWRSETDLGRPFLGPSL
jgi:hypothetical protein